MNGDNRRASQILECKACGLTYQEIKPAIAHRRCICGGELVRRAPRALPPAPGTAT